LSDLHIWPKEIQEEDGHLKTSAVFEYPNGERKELWFKLPARYRNSVAHNQDPFLLGSIFEAMRFPTQIEVHGEISPSLLRNLDEFQEVWTLWKPDIYSKVDMRAEAEIELPKPDKDSAITAFSMGLDACYSAFSHSHGLRGRSNVNLKAGLLVHGFFDIPISKKVEFEHAKKAAVGLLDNLGLELIPMVSNIRSVLHYWPDTHGIATAACLNLLSGAYAQGLIPSSDAFQYLRFPWGSTPLTDPMFSSRAFQIIHDGISMPRTQKIKTIADWPEAMTSMRVCNFGWKNNRNCSHCDKCIRTELAFRALGLPIPPCFDHDPTHSDILKLRFDDQNKDYLDILDVARQNSPGETWLLALETVYRYNMILTRLKSSKLGQVYKRLFLRG